MTATIRTLPVQLRIVLADDGGLLLNNRHAATFRELTDADVEAIVETACAKAPAVMQAFAGELMFGLSQSGGGLDDSMMAAMYALSSSYRPIGNSKTSGGHTAAAIHHIMQLMPDKSALREPLWKAITGHLGQHPAALSG